MDITITEGIDYGIAYPFSSLKAQIDLSVPTDTGAQLILKGEVANCFNVGDEVLVSHRAGCGQLAGKAEIVSIDGNIVEVVMADGSMIDVRGSGGEIWLPRNMTGYLLYLVGYTTAPSIGKANGATVSVDRLSNKLLVRNLAYKSVMRGDRVDLPSAGIAKASVLDVMRAKKDGIEYLLLTIDKPANNAVANQPLELHGGLILTGLAKPSPTVPGLMAGVISTAAIRQFAKYLPPSCAADCGTPTLMGCYEMILVKGTEGTTGTRTYLAESKEIVCRGKLYLRPSAIEAFETLGI